MKNLSQMVIVLCIFAFLGCATTNTETKVKKIKIDLTTPVCNAGPQCDAMWEAAQLWVVHNADYKIQTVTSVLIETYNPGTHSTEMAARITKEPAGGGQYKILASLWCNNIFWCSKDSLDAILDFNNTVNLSSSMNK